MHLPNFLIDEFLVVQGGSQRGHALATGEDVHRQEVRVLLAAQQRELAAQPDAEQREQLVGLAARRVAEFCQLHAQGAHRAAVALDIRSIDEQDVDEAADSSGGRGALELPSLEHLACLGKPALDGGVEDVVLGFEVVVEVAARDLHRLGDVGERRVREALPIEELVGSFHDLVSRRLVAHRHRF